MSHPYAAHKHTPSARWIRQEDKGGLPHMVPSVLFDDDQPLGGYTSTSVRDWWGRESSNTAGATKFSSEPIDETDAWVKYQQQLAMRGETL